jgi:hypothetical protein
MIKVDIMSKPTYEELEAQLKEAQLTLRNTEKALEINRVRCDAVSEKRDTLAAQVEVLKGVMQSMADAHLEDDEVEAAEQFLIHIRATPASCLAQVKADAGRAGWLACCDWIDSDKIKQTCSDEQAANQYAERIRQEVV